MVDDGVTVNGISEDDWDVLRRVRLRALAEAPFAFISSLDEEITFDEPAWRKLTADSAWFVARTNSHDIGLAAGTTIDEPDSSSGAERHLAGLWVSPPWRRRNVARQLVQSVGRWARADGARTLSLWVAVDNEHAERAYRRVGFRRTDTIQPLPGSTNRDEMKMVIDVTEAAECYDRLAHARFPRQQQSRSPDARY